MDRWAGALRFVGIGFFIGGSIVSGVALGIWLDRKFDIAPLFTLLGLGIGLLVAFWGVYRMLQSYLHGQDKDKGGR